VERRERGGNTWPLYRLRVQERHEGNAWRIENGNEIELLMPDVICVHAALRAAFFSVPSMIDGLEVKVLH
jgi:hypothetical protein